MKEKQLSAIIVYTHMATDDKNFLNDPWRYKQKLQQT